MIIFFYGLFQVLPCFLLVVAVLIPVIGGASSLADANSNVDVRVPQDPIPPPGLVSCCIPKGQSKFSNLKVSEFN